MRTGIIKALVLLFLCGVIFGPAGYFSYKLFVKPKRALKQESQRPRPTLPPDPSIAGFEKCMKVKESGDLEAARQAFDDFVAHNPDSPKIDEARDALGETNAKLFFSDAPSPDKQQYVIQKGDLIGTIERKTKTPSELIMRLNKIEDPTKLRIGEVLNITKPDFSIKINRKTKIVTLFNKGKFFKQYHVKAWGVPVSKNAAPVSTKVNEKSAWKNNQRIAFGNKEYAESGRWIACGIAGYTLYTDEPESGTPKPPGGIGMSSEDMQELSTLLNRNTPVIIE